MFDHKQYYREHKEAISVRRKKKYAEDPVYRKRVKRRSAAYHRIFKRKMAPTDRGIVIATDGSKYLTVGKVAVAINRKKSTVQYYNTKGVIPDPKVMDSRGWRLYTREQVILLREAFKKFDRGELGSLKEVTAFITKRWEDCDAKSEE